jgi:CRP/FNR family transcriptional regulator, cyclic AMP receptor protein
MKEPNPDLNTLRTIFILQDLQDEELAAVWGASLPREFPAGSVIMAEGEPGEKMYILLEGEVEVTKRLLLPIDQTALLERIMNHLKSKDGVTLGEMALIENDVRSANVTASTDCRMLELSKENSFQLFSQNPVTGVKILFRLSQLLSKRLRKSDEDIVKLTTALVVALER